MAETRRRITEAAVELHGTIGPARTTLSAVAERAGVQRHTVYRHFPTEARSVRGVLGALLRREPVARPSSPGARSATRGSGSRAHSTSSTPTTSAPNRCSATSSATPSSSTQSGPPSLPFQAYLAEAAAILAAGWPTRGRRRRVLDAALHHAVDFQTWRSLTEERPHHPSRGRRARRRARRERCRASGPEGVDLLHAPASPGPLPYAVRSLRAHDYRGGSDDCRDRRRHEGRPVGAHARRRAPPATRCTGTSRPIRRHWSARSARPRCATSCGRSRTCTPG